MIETYQASVTVKRDGQTVVEDQSASAIQTKQGDGSVTTRFDVEVPDNELPLPAERSGYTICVDGGAPIPAQFHAAMQGLLKLEVSTPLEFPDDQRI